MFECNSFLPLAKPQTMEQSKLLFLLLLEVKI